MKEFLIIIRILISFLKEGEIHHMNHGQQICSKVSQNCWKLSLPLPTSSPNACLAHQAFISPLFVLLWRLSRFDSFLSTGGLSAPFESCFVRIWAQVPETRQSSDQSRSNFPPLLPWANTQSSSSLVKYIHYKVQTWASNLGSFYFWEC